MFLPKFYVRKMGPQVAKRLVLQIRNPQIVQFAEGPLIQEIRKFADLQFTKLICGPPTFEN